MYTLWCITYILKNEMGYILYFEIIKKYFVYILGYDNPRCFPYPYYGRLKTIRCWSSWKTVKLTTDIWSHATIGWTSICEKSSAPREMEIGSGECRRSTLEDRPSNTFEFPMKQVNLIVLKFKPLLFPWVTYPKVLGVISLPIINQFLFYSYIPSFWALHLGHYLVEHRAVLRIFVAGVDLMFKFIQTRIMFQHIFSKSVLRSILEKSPWYVLRKMDLILESKGPLFGWGRGLKSCQTLCEDFTGWAVSQIHELGRWVGGGKARFNWYLNYSKIMFRQSFTKRLNLV